MKSLILFLIFIIICAYAASFVENIIVNNLGVGPSFLLITCFGVIVGMLLIIIQDTKFVNIFNKIGQNNADLKDYKSQQEACNLLLDNFGVPRKISESEGGIIELRLYGRLEYLLKTHKK